MEYSDILCEKADGLLTITLNRPDRMNAFTYGMRDELLDAFDRADADDDVRAVIITGAGRAFCAGADLAGDGESLKGETPDAPFRDGGGMVTLRMFDLNKPIIAAFNGAAAGIGATLCLAADVRIAASHAKFGFVFTRRGVVLESCAAWFLPRIVGMPQALRWAVSGALFPAAEALRHGLVSELVEAQELLPRAREICRELTADTSAVSVALVRRMLWQMAGADHPMEAHRMESALFGAMGKSPDAAEGVASFFEKRPPAFPMRPSRDMPDTARFFAAPDYEDES
ncbi:enoyl-CoA hydratase-related protein [Pseudohoeflea coraliihabitans]|uniref:Enoyl-CoA hydratase/isomerase family protein n=1 Tax=Pseudohoeflea coraliihabitans TaxID=2860393 RepID=A0ABS6WSM9_9HYPH|nr:enoyl-CoA hydratase-related protein [Pseudohoeflea sp. DP4N28-3]MBW3098972.1 enoyl-CoA hydratase/isomerase family protein [Pseudohoeflea sp. DP4N28-3]